MEKFGALLKALDEAIEGKSKAELIALGFDYDYGYPFRDGQEFIEPEFLKAVLEKLSPR